MQSSRFHLPKNKCPARSAPAPRRRPLPARFDHRSSAVAARARRMPDAHASAPEQHVDEQIRADAQRGVHQMARRQIEIDRRARIDHLLSELDNTSHAVSRPRLRYLVTASGRIDRGHPPDGHRVGAEPFAEDARDRREIAAAAQCGHPVFVHPGQAPRSGPQRSRKLFRMGLPAECDDLAILANARAQRRAVRCDRPLERLCRRFVAARKFVKRIGVGVSYVHECAQTS
ncbi:hypothetical protein X980_6276 [Burkholderia pseudomallei MSHR4000]|nr:hypothetical protein X980_6276 [Burkholderia pseudomallei MSHR4000]